MLKYLLNQLLPIGAHIIDSVSVHSKVRLKRLMLLQQTLQEQLQKCQIQIHSGRNQSRVCGRVAGVRHPSGLCRVCDAPQPCHLTCTAASVSP